MVLDHRLQVVRRGTYRSVKEALHDPGYVGTFTGPAGAYRQTTTPTAETKRILASALHLDAPPRILHPHTGGDEPVISA